jgi:hypothetical protein
LKVMKVSSNGGTSRTKSKEVVKARKGETPPRAAGSRPRSITSLSYVGGSGRPRLYRLCDRGLAFCGVGAHRE